MIHTSHTGRAYRKAQITPNNLIKNQNANIDNENVRTTHATVISPSSSAAAAGKPFLKADQNTITNKKK